MVFPTFDFNMDQLFTWNFWKRWLIEFIGCTLFGITVGYLGQSAAVGTSWAWGISYLVWTSVTSATILSTVTINDTFRKNTDLISGVSHLVAQGLAVNLTTCKYFSESFGVAQFSSHAGVSFWHLLSRAALLEWFTVFLFFFLYQKTCGCSFPEWLFKTLIVASAFWLNPSACFTPSRIWAVGVDQSWAIIFGTYINHFVAVYFGTNVAQYIFD